MTGATSLADSMLGILNIDKPSGPSSRDVVNRVQALIGTRKVGHAGTLDPLASGVLVVCLGSATRLVPYVQAQAKQYRGTFLLGRRSNTEDIQGLVEETSTIPPTRVQIEETLRCYTGNILQRPPDYSALKVNGTRSYKLAREGKPVRHEPRSVIVHAISLHSYDFPALTIDVTCGSGTYIRSLGRDIATALGTSAVMSALRRTAIGPYDVEDAVKLASLSVDSVRDAVLPPITAVSSLPQVDLADSQIRELGYGRTVEHPDGLVGDHAGVDEQGQLVAILRASVDGRYRIVRNFAHARNSEVDQSEQQRQGSS